MTEAADFCWVGADGALHSGSARELMHAFLTGTLPAAHPVWRQGWSEWVLLADVIAERRLEPERDTLHEPMRFADPDATFEDVTQPFRRASVAPPTLRSEAPKPPVPRASLPPGGMAHTLPPPPQRTGPSLRVPALIGAALALVGAASASAIVLSAALEAPERALGRGLAGVPRLPAAAAVAAAPAAAEPGGCSTRGAPVEVSERIAPGTSLHLADAGPGRVAIGVASTEKSGFGITLALEPLSVVGREALADPVHLGGVVPHGGKFWVDRFSTRVPGAESFSLGMTPSGFSRIAEDGSQTTLWPGQASEVISRPVVVDAGDAGLALAFRRGDADSGVVRMGWLDAHGQRRGELGTLSVASGAVDAPALAAGNGRVLLAYAARQPLDAPWGIELGAAKAGDLPAATLRFTGGERGKDQQRPALAALPGERWLLAWVEGDRRSGRRIRAQVLSASLAPLGAPLELASSRYYVGSLAVHARGAELVVLFSERSRRQSEILRAVRASCR